MHGCNKCDVAFYLDNGNCYPKCNDSCKKCYKGIACMECTSGYYLDSYLHACIPCSDNCTECNSTSCITCIHPYSINPIDGTCRIVCQSNCKICNETDCLVCNDGNFQLIQGICTSACDQNCKTCNKNNICTDCNVGYYLNTNSMCRACGSNCVNCTNSNTCTACSSGYIILSGSCTTCVNVIVTDASFDSTFSSITITFSVSVTNPVSISCDEVISTQDDIGKSPTCSSHGFQFTLTFGEYYSFTNNSLFTIYLPSIFPNLCNTPDQYYVNLTANYIAAPDPLSFIITGVSIQSLICDSISLSYYANNLIGNYLNYTTYNWSGIVSPDNANVTNCIQTQYSDSIEIPLSLFNGISSNLIITLHGQNALQSKYHSSFSTQITVNTQLSVIIDAGIEVSIKSAIKNVLTAALYDSCGTVDRAVYLWVFSGTNNKNYDSSLLDLKKSYNQLIINKHALPTGFYYNFTVTVTTLGVSGSASISVFSEASSLELILSKGDSSIPSSIDLFINGDQSYDPDNTTSSLNYL